MQHLNARGLPTPAACNVFQCPTQAHSLLAGVDLVSFSGILYSIYPPLFLALLVYSIGGTGTSLFLGRKLVGLNFQQEAQEANFRRAQLSSTMLRHVSSTPC